MAGGRKRNRGGNIDRAMVVAVTVAVTALVPLGVTEVGETEHTGPCESTGNTEQLRLVGWLKPPVGVTESV